MGSTGAAMWARADVRARWKALVALGLLVGVTAGFAMAAYAGARRTDTSFLRLRERTNAPDAVVFATQTSAFVIDPAKWDELARLPEVDKVAPWVLAIGDVEGDDSGVIMGSYDDRWIGDVDRGILVDGRMYDADAPDEAVIEEDAAKSEGIKVGDTIGYRPFLMKQFSEENPGPPAGPQLQIKVVGIVRTIEPHLFASLAMMSPGVIKHHPDIAFGTNAMVQLKNDSADMPAFQRDVNRIISPGTPILDLHEAQRRVDTTLDVEAAALRLLALAIALAGGLLVGQALSRSAATIQTDVPVLRAIGMSRREMASAAVRGHVLVLGVALLSAFGTAVVLSRWFPIGLGHDIEPDHGFHADWVVLSIGLAATALFVSAVVAAIAFRSATAPRAAAARSSKVLDGIQRRTPLSVGVGTAMVMERGRARVNVPVRQAIAGAVIGVVGVAATITINASLRETLAHPERAGVVWDATVSVSDSVAPETLNDAVMKRIAARPEIVASARVSRSLLPINNVGVQTFTVEDVSKRSGVPIAFTLLDGRAPANAGEVVVGPATGKDANATIGDTVVIGANKTRARVVGHALFPQDVHAEFDEGVWLTAAGLTQAGVPDDAGGEPQRPEAALAVRFAPGVGHEAALAKLGEDLGENFSAAPADTPPELTNLRRVRSLPIVLAVFLALLAFAALLHVLMTVARTRRSDFAVLRALGMTRRATRGVFNVQGTVIAMIGLLVGIPVGVALGRTVWRLIADSVPLQDVSPTGLLALAVIGVATLLVANVLALWPGQRAARLQPAEVLRSE